MKKTIESKPTKQKAKTFTVIAHYEQGDEDYDGDYCEIEIECEGKIIAVFGSHYDDKGREKCEGFIEGVRWVLGENAIKVVKKKVVDRGY